MHQTGTDRCAEVAEKFDNYDIIINIQGDEPLIDSRQIDTLMVELFKDDKVKLGTLIKSSTDLDILNSAT